MLRPPIEPMHAAAVMELPVPQACAGGCAYEPKWDGWRVLLFVEDDRVYLQSRSGKPLAAYFPDITRLARQALPVGVVVDGELIIWETLRGRTSFALLQRRVAAGRGLLGEVAAHPAHLVAFDLLHDTAGALMASSLAERRTRLATLLTIAPPQLTLCPQTTDPETATMWLAQWADAGVEGLVIKGLASAYEPGRRGWAKLRSRSTAEAIIGGVTGSLTNPDTLLLGRLDDTGRLRYVGRTHPLAAGQRRQLGEQLSPAVPRRTGGLDHPWPQPLPATWSGRFGQAAPLPYIPVQPTTVVEVQVNTAFEHGRWRHPPAFVRDRPDLSIYEVPTHTTTEF
jgi:ATP-dependent DNA ligase